MKTSRIVLIMIVLVIVFGGIYVWERYQQRATNTTAPSTQLANPASVHCVTDLHGTLEIRDESNGQVGYCHLPDGTTCEEWALMRGECAAAITTSSTPVMNTDLYPLYSNVTWSPAISTTTEDLSGLKVTAVAATGTNDIASATRAFTTYYEQKLVAAGWKQDTSREAGGPGAAIESYQKGNSHALFGFTSVFHGGGANEPEHCPCDVTLFVFSSQIDQ